LQRIDINPPVELGYVVSQQPRDLRQAPAVAQSRVLRQLL